MLLIIMNAKETHLYLRKSVDLVYCAIQFLLYNLTLELLATAASLVALCSVDDRAEL